MMLVQRYLQLKIVFWQGGLPPPPEHTSQCSQPLVESTDRKVIGRCFLSMSLRQKPDIRILAGFCWTGHYSPHVYQALVALQNCCCALLYIKLRYALMCTTHKSQDVFSLNLVYFDYWWCLILNIISILPIHRHLQCISLLLHCSIAKMQEKRICCIFALVWCIFATFALRFFPWTCDWTKPFPQVHCVFDAFLPWFLLISLKRCIFGTFFHNMPCYIVKTLGVTLSKKWFLPSLYIPLHNSHFLALYQN